ncbi:MAG: sialate O-acetylesterase [Candidatus Thalassarchaeaceae archaeon]|jgi:hypothetical protein|nr:sialate O-acetylesterase [Candidatus Thalassarchaeaceae archaeon]
MRTAICAIFLTLLLAILPLNSIDYSEVLSDEMELSLSASSDVPSSSNFTTVFELDIPEDGKFNNEDILYSTDNSANIDFTFDQVAYYLELQRLGEDRIWVWVSFPALTTDASELGVPTFASGAEFNQLLTNVRIESNHPNLTNLGTIDTGVIEFWGTNYAASNALAVPNANGSSYDFGDTSNTNEAGYGSMQIHDYESGETLFSYSAWGYASGGGSDDLGIGNNPDSAGNPDWTFSGSAKGYDLRTLSVMVHPGPIPTELMFSIESPDSHQIVQRDDYNWGTFPVHGSTLYTADLIEGRYTPLDNGTPSEWNFVSTPIGFNFYGTLDVPVGWHRLDLRFINDGVFVDSIIIEPVGVGEVFIISGQSNSANFGEYPLTPTDTRVSTWGPEGWRFGHDPQPGATGNSGSPWPVVGDLLTSRYDVPVGFLSVGYGGTQVDRWVPSANDLFYRITDALDAVQPSGARAILWHQGESNAGGTSTEDYAEMLSAVVLGSRNHIGDEIPWLVARVGFTPSANPVKSGWIVEGQNTVIDADPLTYAGPYTDDLNGSEWRYDLIHFNEAGLREHASRWDARIATAMTDLLHIIEDTDGDGIYDDDDLCPQTPTGIDIFTDGCSEEQREPGSTIDSDGDGIMDNSDYCANTTTGQSVYADGCSDHQRDGDNDGISDADDQCPGFDDGIDADNDETPDDCDDLLDSDGDGVADTDDLCAGFDDTIDVDADQYPDGCDFIIDSDFDDIADENDQCPGFDDFADMDLDGIADGCDSLIDSDGDGRADFADLCNGHDDSIDEDQDDIPDGCDSYVGAEGNEKSDSVLMQGGLALAAIMLVILLTVISLTFLRKGKSSKIRRTPPSDNTIFSIETGPDPAIDGVWNEGDEWLERPEGSGIWYKRNQETRRWNLHETNE